MSNPINLAAMRGAAEAAFKLYPIDERKEEDGEFDCPMCGDGRVDGATLSTSAAYCAGVQVFGIGDAHVQLEKYLHAANPDTILRLLAVVEAAKEARKQNHWTTVHEILDRALAGL